MSKDKFEDVEVYPPTRSAASDNAYYLARCACVDHRPAYAACLKKIEDRKSGRLKAIYADCSAAIGKKECVALGMRRQELTEDKAIFFVNRQKLVAFRQSEEEQGRQKFAAMPVSKQPKRPVIERAAPPKKPEQKHFLDVGAGSYADAINKAMSAPSVPATKPAAPAPKPAEQPKAPSAPQASVQLKPGMSLLELARMQLQARQAL